MPTETTSVMWFENLTRGDIALVGGKNASLGEMVRTLSGAGVSVPPGFATTADLYRRFVAANGLDKKIVEVFAAHRAGRMSLEVAGLTIRNAFLKGAWPVEAAEAIRAGYRALATRCGNDDIDVAVRSSATAEDLTDASFAGQQETFLNIRGEDAVLDACRRCFASLFTGRAISYRQTKGFDHLKVALSVGVQKMVRSDLGGAGVMFSIDTESGFDKVVLINAAWGLGENIVQGTVDPDEYEVFKPLLDHAGVIPIIEKKLGKKEQKMVRAKTRARTTRNVRTSVAEREGYVLSDAEIVQLARWACAIEAHYGCAMDMEWAKDGESGNIFIVQARPETVQSRRDLATLKIHRVKTKGRLLASGVAIGDAAVSGPVCTIESARDIDHFIDGAVLVTSTTDPDWVPIMKRAAAIVTDHGGRTSHAAIVSRELGLPAVVGTGNATRVLCRKEHVTVSCAEGNLGFVYEGASEIQVDTVGLDSIPATRTRVMLNLADPAAAFRWWQLPADGVGLARMEFVVSNHIRIHPMALAHFDTLKDGADKREIARLTHGYADKTEYFVDRLASGLARIAAAFHPRPVIVRMSDFKTNEYAHLLGGESFEPTEGNPMIGFRGASRYYSPRYREGFSLECKAIARLRRDIGLANVVVMIPFCRTTLEADRVLEVMAENGLRRRADGLEVYVMCEVPSNVILADEFAERFDGFSIGSNDLTQLTLGVDRDSAELSELFDEEDPAVRWMIGHVIDRAHLHHTKVGLCGQAPSDRPGFARFLVGCGIDSISVTPDSFVAVKRHVAAAETANARQWTEEKQLWAEEQVLPAVPI